MNQLVCCEKTVPGIIEKYGFKLASRRNVNIC